VIKALIFDLDGVIVDTAKYHYLAWKRLAEELNIPFTLDDNERLKGVSRMQSLEILLELGDIEMSEEKKETLTSKKNEWFVEYLSGMTPDEIFPGVTQLLSAARKKQLRVALASSSKNAKMALQLLNLQSAFDAVVDGTMIEHTKPAPDIFLLAASKVSIAPANCLVFEDAEAGVEAALAAGMKCVGIGSPIQLGKADLILPAIGHFDLARLEELTTIKKTK
jgi:beta-phosphoglucomutase